MTLNLGDRARSRGWRSPKDQLLGSDMLDVEGINRERVTAWFEANVPEVKPPLDFQLIAGGHSNLTFAVTDSASKTYVLRRPPLGHVLESAYDMAREHRIVSALARSAVPVARSPRVARRAVPRLPKRRPRPPSRSRKPRCSRAGTVTLTLLSVMGGPRRFQSNGLAFCTEVYCYSDRTVSHLPPR